VKAKFLSDSGMEGKKLVQVRRPWAEKGGRRKSSTATAGGKRGGGQKGANETSTVRKKPSRYSAIKNWVGRARAKEEEWASGFKKK